MLVILPVLTLPPPTLHSPHLPVELAIRAYAAMLRTLPPPLTFHSPHLPVEFAMRAYAGNPPCAEDKDAVVEGLHRGDGGQQRRKVRFGGTK